MNINYGNIITLSDKKEYAVAGIANYNNFDYVYLVDINDHTNMKFAWLKENSVVVLDNKLDYKLIETLIPLFLASAKEFMGIEE